MLACEDDVEASALRKQGRWTRDHLLLRYGPNGAGSDERCRVARARGGELPPAVRGSDPRRVVGRPRDRCAGRGMRHADQTWD